MREIKDPWIFDISGELNKLLTTCQYCHRDQREVWVWYSKNGVEYNFVCNDCLYDNKAKEDQE